MPRIKRFLDRYSETTYHIISRTALQGYPLENVEKEYMVRLIKKMSFLYFVDIIGFSIMGNHFHLLAKIKPKKYATKKRVIEKYKKYYGEDAEISGALLKHYQNKLTNLSDFVKTIKQSFTVFYNKRHNRKGAFWDGRFKSIIVENGETLINCLAYIDLNPIRAGLVKKPENYRFCSISYHIAGNEGDFLSVDFGQWDKKDKNERLRLYRKFLYENGAISKNRGGAIPIAMLKKEKGKKYKLNATDRLRYKTRYFADGGIIGSMEFVQAGFNKFKHLLKSKNNRKMQPITGLNGVYSMKKLS